MVAGWDGIEEPLNNAMVKNLFASQLVDSNLVMVRSIEVLR